MDQLIRDLVRQASAERAAVELFVAVDRRDWPRVRRLLADRVEVDLPRRGLAGWVEADALVESWALDLAGFDALHHQIGNLRTTIHQDDAHVACYATIHLCRRPVPGGEASADTVLLGTYDIGLLDSPRGWHVRTLRFKPRLSPRPGP